ncbi:UPF0246 protein YaaA [Methylophaga frappieri]|uniref:UPF0246 protein Q7C_1155 n=1 Tax=Methylophaga frappieri (strain ATCC BAA-2434 / DSM 25690 / JAM7) TaxID=754477 RepID=I1YHB7_METFJ|nr:peroxide stress protein YaaA [Methylophaga frappieri]AFJ02310.1 UPF0246 protein YaaA [Methylophaga frappieri]
MITIISPAKTLDFESVPTTTKCSQPALLDQSEKLIKALRCLSAQELASLMSISDKLAGLNVARYQAWHTPFTLENAKQAVLAFQGDVYTGLAAESLDQKGLDFAQKHLRILSGLYGVLKPLDLMQAYRLEMGTRFAPGNASNLYQFWGDLITDTLSSDSAFTCDNTLINLASNEYFKAINTKRLSAKIITPVFKDEKNGQYKIISFYAKKARGLMSRYIIDNRIDNPDELNAFNSQGYRYSEAMSQANSPTFIRDQQ